MVQIELPLADPSGSTGSPTAADRAASAPFDWRQLSHELRTPLNAILGNTELLLDGSCGPLSAKARACLDEVQSAGRQLLHQAQLLLAWSELRADGSQLAKRRVDLIALAREALTTGRPDAVQVAPPDARLPIHGDRSRLRILFAEMGALDGARGAPLELRLETSARQCALSFAWPGFWAARPGALQIALIEAIARSQGAELSAHQDGLVLLWPWQQLERPGADDDSG